MGVRKRIREQAREKRKKRKVKPTILIISEGNNTEVNYFKNFNTRYTRVDIKIADKNSTNKNKGKKTDPLNLVKKAIEYKKKKYDINHEDGDRIWCIFDVDINYNNPNPIETKQEEIENAYNKARRENIKLGISNPCFELWYLLHFKYTTSHLKDYNSVKSKLEQQTPIKKYDKSINIYDLLKDNIQTAISNVKKLKKHHEELGRILPNVEKENTHLNIKHLLESNPYTNIGDLIEYINELEEKNI